MPTGWVDRTRPVKERLCGSVTTVISLSSTLFLDNQTTVATTKTVWRSLSCLPSTPSGTTEAVTSTTDTSVRSG
ncbi:hypothetical protein BaRGS_00018795, partial [Batillaria attramentaria]